MEVERDVRQAPAIIRQPGHVTGLAPAAAGLPVGWVAGVVVEEGVEAATGDYDLDARVKDGGVDGVVPAQRMADGAELPLAHEGQRFEQIQPADVVPDGFHGAALVAERLEVGLVVGHDGIGRREHHVTALGQVTAVGAVVGAELLHDYAVAVFHVGRVQRQHGGELLLRAQGRFWDQQIGRDA